MMFYELDNIILFSLETVIMSDFNLPDINWAAWKSKDGEAGWCDSSMTTTLNNM